MAPKLYFVTASPPARAVIMCAKVLGVELEYVTVNLLEGEHMKESYLKKCPQHTVPLLEEDDGFTLADSHAIMAYLVAKYGKDDTLFPKNNLKLRAKIDHLMHFDSGVLFAAGANISKPLFFENKKPTEEKLKRLRDAFQIADTMLATNKQKFAVADHVTLADFSLLTTVTAFELFEPLGKYPNLKAYVERMRQASWYQYTKEEEQLLKTMFEGKLKELA